MQEITATYSPEDDKIRLYPLHRLSAEDYQRVKSAGYSWAPKQECFYAVWSPSREDLALEFADEIEDEDKSLVERAEERAERFEGYSERRLEDAHRAREAVLAIDDNIPLGQPILVGHHSERRARKDAERIENGMRKAISLWETSKYWTSRAASAVRAAKYKERPDVRARRIKGLEADRRKLIAEYTPHTDKAGKILVIMQEPWTSEGYGKEKIPHVWVGPKGRGGHWVAQASLERIKAHNERWIAHIDNRLLYERAMLDEQGGLKAQKFDIEVGGRVLVSGEWVTVIRINKSTATGEIASLTTNRRYVSTVGIEEVSDYQPPAKEEQEAVKAALKKPPICNYPGMISIKNRWEKGKIDPPKQALEMTSAEWKRIHNYKGTQTVENAEHGPHRVRFCFRSSAWHPVFITDSKRVDPPAQAVVKAERPKIRGPERDISSIDPVAREPEDPSEFDALKDTLKAGVQVAVAPQLFPTPPELARRVVDLAGCMAGKTILEPSAGTGSLIRAAVGSATGFDSCKITAVELNHNCVQALETMRLKFIGANEGNFRIVRGDFLECNGDLGKFDAVVMNPPFDHGTDIQHVKHALGFLKPGGRLVAIVANGPRQQRELKPLGEWIELEPGTFKDAGTNVNTAIVIIDNE